MFVTILFYQRKISTVSIFAKCLLKKKKKKKTQKNNNDKESRRRTSHSPLHMVKRAASCKRVWISKYTTGIRAFAALSRIERLSMKFHDCRR